MNLFQQCTDDWVEAWSNHISKIYSNYQSMVDKQEFQWTDSLAQEYANFKGNFHINKSCLEQFKDMIIQRRHDEAIEQMKMGKPIPVDSTNVNANSGHCWYEDQVKKFKESYEGMGYQVIVDECDLSPYFDQIVAFRLKSTGEIVKRTENGWFGDSSKRSQSSLQYHLINNPKWEIFTVRNSNHDEFSIGSSHLDIKISGNEWKIIKSFNVSADKLYADIGEVYFPLVDSLIPSYPEQVLKAERTIIEERRKHPFARTPLLVVEGKELFEGDEFWYIYNDYWENIQRVKIGIAFTSDFLDNKKTFLTRESAEQWIRNNKPSISWNDLSTFCFKYSPGLPGEKYAPAIKHILDHFKPKP